MPRAIQYPAMISSDLSRIEYGGCQSGPTVLAYDSESDSLRGTGSLARWQYRRVRSEELAHAELNMLEGCDGARVAGIPAWLESAAGRALEEERIVLAGDLVAIERFALLWLAVAAHNHGALGLQREALELIGEGLRARTSGVSFDRFLRERTGTVARNALAEAEIACSGGPISE